MQCCPFRRRRGTRCCTLALFTALATLVPLLPAGAQSMAPAVAELDVVPQDRAAERPPVRRIEGAATVGFSTFIDENFIEHVTVGAAVRVPFSGRWSIEPRFTYMRGGVEQEWFYALASVIYDLEPRGPVTPYWTAGGGMFWHRDGRIDFVARDRHFSGGMGVRIRLADRWSLVSEARFGIEPFFQAHAGLGYSFTTTRPGLARSR